MVDWSEIDTIKPTKRQKNLYYRWKAYLKDSKLSTDEIERRSRQWAEFGHVPDDSLEHSRKEK